MSSSQLGNSGPNLGPRCGYGRVCAENPVNILVLVGALSNCLDNLTTAAIFVEERYIYFQTRHFFYKAQEARRIIFNSMFAF